MMGWLNHHIDEPLLVYLQGSAAAYGDGRIEDIRSRARSRCG